jgi:hypothetical protein
LTVDVADPAPPGAATTAPSSTAASPAAEFDFNKMLEEELAFNRMLEEDSD